MEKSKRIVISCGGTAGHFNPGLGIAVELKRLGGEPLILLGGKKRDQEKQLLAAQSNGIEARLIKSMRKPANPFLWIFFPFMLASYIYSCVKIYLKFKPRAVLSMGCYASFPAAAAAILTPRVPLFIHDGNARIGKANILMSLFARCAFLSFPAVNSSRLKCAVSVTGLPLRESLLKGAVAKKEAVDWLNETYGVSFDAAKPVMLIFGGSLGARTLNEGVMMDNSDPAVAELQIIHLSGAGQRELVAERYKAFKCKSLILESCQEMRYLYSMADCVISRSGGSTVSELAFFGRYALLIPYPYAAENHQEDNAGYLCSGGGAEYVCDSECSGAVFSSFISRFLSDVEGYRLRGEKSLKLAKPNAAETLIEELKSKT